MRHAIFALALGALTTLAVADPASPSYRLGGSCTTQGADAADSPLSTRYALSAFSLGGTCGEAASPSYRLLAGCLEVPVTGLVAPASLAILVDDEQVRLSWTAVPGATAYRVYSSAAAYGGFTEDTGGHFDDAGWSAPLPAGSRFYAVLALR